MRWLAANISFLFTDLPFLARFAAARDCGFRAVECLFPYDHDPLAIVSAARAAGVRIVLINAAPGDWEGGERGFAALPGRDAEFGFSIEQAARYAAALGVRQVHVLAGNADPDDPDARECYERRLRRAAARLARDRITPLIEPINPVDMPGYFLSSFDRAREIIGAIGVDRIGLQFDLYHCQRIHGDALSRLSALLPFVRHIQLAGVPDRHEPNDRLPLAPILELLARADYNGWIGCEYHPLGDTARGLCWVRDFPVLEQDTCAALS